MAYHKSRHREIKEPVLEPDVQEVNIVSFDHHRPPLLQIGNSIDLIKQHVFGGDEVCIYPKLDSHEDTGIRWTIHQRLRSSYKTCFAYTAKMMSVSCNIAAKPASAEAIYDVIVFVPDGPTTVFTVISDKVRRRQKNRVLEYNQTLAKGIVASVRRYTKEQFSVVFGLMTESDVMDDDKFKKAIDRIRVKTSKWCIPVALSMSDEKFEEVTSAFIMSVAFTNCVFTNKVGNSLNCLTLEQFRVLTENIDHNQVEVNSRPSCGGDVLLLEIAQRLEKSGHTAIVAKSETLLTTARRLSICKDHIIPADKLESETLCQISGIVNIVADFDISGKVPGIDKLGRIWFFVRGSQIVETKETDNEQKQNSAKDNMDVKTPEYQTLTDWKPLGHGQVSPVSILTKPDTGLSINDNISSMAAGDDTFNSGQQEQLLKPVRSVMVPNKSVFQVFKPYLPTKYGARRLQGWGNFTTINLLKPVRSVLERSKAEVLRCSDKMVNTEIVQKAREQLESNKVLTVTGAPGEGKSTVAYLILNAFLKEKWEVFVLKSPGEFFQLHIQSKTIVLFNDIFGSIYFHPNELRRWKPVLEDVQQRLYSTGDPGFLAIFTSRDYILQEATSQLEKFQTFLFSRQMILNITKTSISTSDRKKIFKCHQLQHPEKEQLSNKDIDELVGLTIPYGFPSICLLFFTLRDTTDKPEEFFVNPKQFLDDTITANWQNLYKRAAYCLLVYEEGQLDLSKLILSKEHTTKQRQIANMLKEILEKDYAIPNENLSVHFMKLREAIDNMTGSHLKTEEHFVCFAHASVQERVTVIICKHKLKFIIDHSRLSYLKDIVQFSDDGTISSCLDIPLVNWPISDLMNRLVSELIKGNISEVLSHSVFKTHEGVKELLSRASLQRLLHMKDARSNHSFLYRLCSNGDEKLIRSIVQQVTFSRDMVSEVILGCCEYGNQSCFELMQSDYAEHVLALSAESDFVEAAFRTAINNNQTAIIKTLIRELNLQNQHQHIDFNKMFIKAAEMGLTDVVEALIGGAVFVNVRDENGWTALHFASLQRNIELAKLLHRRGSQIDGCTLDGLSPLHLAARGSFIALMRWLRSRGANVHLRGQDGESLLHTAVETGNVDVVREVISYGVRQNLKTNTKGQTALHLAAASGHCDIITLLKQRSNAMLDQDKEGNTPLHLIVETGSLRAVRSVEGALNRISANIRNKAGFALIHIAVDKGYKDILELILKHECFVDVKSLNSLTALHFAKLICESILGSGFAPIHYAALKTDDYFVNVLLQYGADINIRNSHRDTNGETALHFAAMNGLKKSVLTLIRHGADLNMTTRTGDTALSLAAAHGHTQTVEVLIKAGLNVNARNKTGSNSLHVSAMNNQESVVKAILASGGDTNARLNNGETPLHTACDMGNVGIVKHLIAHGGDVHIADNRLWTPCHFAAQSGHPGILKILYGEGVNLDATTVEGLTPFHVALMYGNEETAISLLQMHCDVQHRTPQGLTVLHLAATLPDRKLLMLLLALDMDINASCQKGNTPLHYSVRSGSVDVASELLDRGANVNARTVTNESPLSLSTYLDHSSLVSLCVRHGAHVNTENIQEVTPLHIACAMGNTTIAEILIHAGADVNARTRKGLTPLHMAALRGKTDIVEILLDANSNTTLVDMKGAHACDYALVSGHFELYLMLIERQIGLMLLKKLIFLAIHLLKPCHDYVLHM